MNKQQSISDISNKVKLLCANAKSEDDIKAAVALLINSLNNSIELKELSHHHEVTSSHGGRADSIYSNIIFEYKKLDTFRNEKGILEAIYGRDQKDHGLFHYIINFSLSSCKVISDSQLNSIICSKVGVGFDGKSFIFCRFKQESKCQLDRKINEKTKAYPKGLTETPSLSFEYEHITDFDRAVKKLILFLRSTDRMPLTADNMLESFSSKTSITRETIKYLYMLLEQNLTSTPNTRIITLYNEWERIFGEIFNEDSQSSFTEFSAELISMYNLDVELKQNKIDIKKILFVLQTYYSALIKLLIHNLLESLNDPTKLVKKAEYRNELTSLFSGNSLANYPIKNFFEIHFFEWFILAQDFDMTYINSIIDKLDFFETTASVIKPESVEDVLKKVYSNLIPKKLRHLMGEYYTPNWLVDFTIEKSGYGYELDKTILDPTCGSGAFLTHVIKGFKKHHGGKIAQHEIISTVLKNVVGFDINPIAVVSCKANYILALGDITEVENDFSIPIYMCDSILVPTIHAKQQEEDHAIKIKTVVGEFTVPIFNDVKITNLFLDSISQAILLDYCSFDIFYTAFQKEYPFINITNEQLCLMQSFFDQLHKLHLSGADGFWPTILKNSFAPLFLHDKFDVIVGNPPWIGWKSMSSTYREMTLDIWLSYGIFEKSAYDKITSHDDFAMAVTYVCIDHYLKKDGIMAFVLPQTFVKSLKGGEGFRKFSLTRDNINVPFAITSVYDMLKIDPFRGEAANKTSVYIFQKNILMTYPMNYYYECFNLIDTDKIKYTDDYNNVIQNKLGLTKLSARPINEDIRSPWLTIDINLATSLNKYLGKSPYSGRKGIEPCGAKGIYIVEVLGKKNNLVLIKNMIERSRLTKAKELGIKEGYIEKDFVYPMVGGRNIDKWGINSNLFMVVPHYSNGKAVYRGVPVEELQAQYKETYKWLFYFHDLLLETRIRSAKFFNEKDFPFYRLDNIGDYTFSKYKVLWREQSSQMTSVVVSELDTTYLSKKLVVTDSKVLYVSFEDKAEAHYLCAILNSKIIGKIIKSYTIDVQKGIDIVKNIKIPKFNPENLVHKLVSSLSIKAHLAYNENKLLIKDIEDEIEVLIDDIF